MQIVNATSGKIGVYFMGPKQYLNQSIRLGEVAICVGREQDNAGKPYIWLIGGIDRCTDYISLARNGGELESGVCDQLLAKLDEAAAKMPKTAHERLANFLGFDGDEVKELIALTQICVTQPIEGVKKYSDVAPDWTAKSVSYAPIH